MSEFEMKSCTLTHNIHMHVVHTQRHSTFEGNSGTNGIVSVGYAPLLFRGTNHFIGNHGTSALRVRDPLKLTAESSLPFLL